MTLKPDAEAIWSRPEIVDWTQHLLRSYRRWVGRDLMAPQKDAIAQSQALFSAPFVVVSHGTQASPIFNYGNQTALDLWEVPWKDFVQMPSNQSVEPDRRAERQQMLEACQKQGFFENYRGIRISRTGRRFGIEQVLIWNVVDEGGDRLGQAATFANWTFLLDEESSSNALS